MEDETVSVERLREAAVTQNGLAADKLIAKEQRLENLKAKVARLRRTDEEHQELAAGLNKDLEGEEESIESLTDTLKLNEKMVAGVQARVYEQIKRRVRLRLDGAFANKQFDFGNNFLVSLDGPA